MRDAKQLTRRQESALAALLAQPTIRAAALDARVSEATVYRWLADELFADAYRRARRDVVSHATARLQAASTDAVETLRAVMLDPKVSAASRVSAARAVIELAHRGVEVEDLAEKIAALEAVAQNRT